MRTLKITIWFIVLLLSGVGLVLPVFVVNSPDAGAILISLAFIMLCVSLKGLAEVTES